MDKEKNGFLKEREFLDQIQVALPELQLDEKILKYIF